MTSEGLGEMFEGDSADMCAGKCPLVSMGGRVEGLACADLLNVAVLFTMMPRSFSDVVSCFSSPQIFTFKERFSFSGLLCLLEFVPTISNFVLSLDQIISFFENQLVTRLASSCIFL